MQSHRPRAVGKWDQWGWSVLGQTYGTSALKFDSVRQSEG